MLIVLELQVIPLSEKEELFCIAFSTLRISEAISVLELAHSCSFNPGVELSILTDIGNYSFTINNFSRETQEIKLILAIPQTISNAKLLIEDMGEFSFAFIDRLFVVNTGWSECITLTDLTSRGSICFLFSTCRPITITKITVDLYLVNELLTTLISNSDEACFLFSDELIKILHISPLTYKIYFEISEPGQNEITEYKKFIYSDIKEPEFLDILLVSTANSIIIVANFNEYMIDIFEGFIARVIIFGMREDGFSDNIYQDVTEIHNEAIMISSCNSSCQEEYTSYFVDFQASNDEEFVAINTKQLLDIESPYKTTIRIESKQLEILFDCTASYCEKLPITGFVQLNTTLGHEYVSTPVKWRNGRIAINISAKNSIRLQEQKELLVIFTTTSRAVTNIYKCQRFILDNYFLVSIVLTIMLGVLFVLFLTVLAILAKKEYDLIKMTVNQQCNIVENQ